MLVLVVGEGLGMRAYILVSPDLNLEVFLGGDAFSKTAQDVQVAIGK